MRRVAMSVAVLALALAGCAVGGDDGGSPDAGGKTQVTFRLWDDQVAKAYEQSFAEFEKQNTDIDVKIELIPWADYWTKLTADVGSGTVSDIFWTNTSNFGIYADNKSLLNIDEKLGDQKADWQKSVVDLYTRDNVLWGVPQLWDSIALFYNKDLVSAAGVDPATLKWSPEGGAADTFLPAAQKLTKGSQFAFNASYDGQSIYWDFVGSNGGVWQNGDAYAFNTPENVKSIQYIVDLINKHHVSPSAADTNENGDKVRDLFIQGKMALFQSGPYNLKNIQEGAQFEWGIAPMLEGPAGRVSVVHGVAAVGSAKTKHADETVKVLEWMGSAEGQKAIAEGGYAFPGVTAAQQGFVDYWSKEGVDVKPFIDAASGKTIPAPIGPRANAGATAVEPILKEVFLGRKPVADGLAEAEKAGNEAIKP
ncbi:ABC transporter substrate-binding protein [Tenggerimyces flavus]|uniref:ABC transporter substrate-binding protein n=1 Tax=Tenggerimyces flavus TaxID=1708749 RepID=A0ABV7YP86_9ACTN|nr:sugar ABC transporter substrate-binding protein [Tenggerimyces flavus]MBM7784850.1 multiple sugar transport system substrate-binding protein [Tenggerimyces flavus]